MDLRRLLSHRFWNPKTNFSRSQNPFGYILDPEIVIFQTSIVGYRFRVGLRPQKAAPKGDPFPMKSPSENQGQAQNTT